MPSEDPVELDPLAEVELNAPTVTAASVRGTVAPVPHERKEQHKEVGEKGGPIPAAGHSSLRTLLGNFSWTTAGQVITLGGNLALTPFVIHGLGLQRYGLFALTATITTFLGTFASGLNGTAARYFPVYAGADDKVATTRLFTTFMVMILALGSVLAVADWFLSPMIVNALSMSPNLRPESLFLFRTLCILVTASAAHGLVQLVATARQRFARPVQVSLVCYLIWVVGLVWVVHHHDGLRGVAIIFVLQQVVATAGVAPLGFHYMTRKGLRLLPWKEVKELMGFAAKVQVTGAAGLVNTQLNTLVIGSALSVRAVGIYNVGANFSDQVWGMAANMLSPAQMHLGNSLGARGKEYVYYQYKRMQRPWVQAVTGLCAVAMGASYFGVLAWLGSSYKLASWTAVVLLSAAPPFLSSLLLTSYVTVMKEAALEMRYGLFAMGTNVVFTLMLVVFGVLGVVAASVLSNFLSAAYLIHLVRKKMHPDLANFFRYMPVFRAVLACALTVVMELLLRPYLPRSGPIALVECAVPGLIGLVFYGVLLVGPRRAVRLSADAVRSRRPPSLREVLSEMG